ncbi:hypothetical protein BJV78DRAFT_1157567 [Lactifluus subvellereus]|nr:hypothetical protein BJV78DRAFT_1157567 [Lactifluus subvellereus]
MQSKPFSFRSTIRTILPGSSTRSNQPVSGTLNPASSEPIDGGGALAMTSIETSLAVLKEASSLGANIPYISPIAGLLLQAITMRDEVKLHKEEWDVVMRKLIRVAGLVVNVGELCEKYNLEERDLPPGLREILQSLQTELGGIEGALKQCTEVGRVKKIILRKELLRKIKQYDGELSNVLQTFQVALALDARLAQLAEGHKVTPSGPSGSSDIVISMSPPPRSPQVFFGRNTELAEIIHIIFTNIGPRPARVAILGPGGYGKTTLANAVLTHPRIQHHFGSARYFIPCESIFSSGALLVEIAKCLGVLHEGSDASWSRIHAILNDKESIICLDNFESPWDQDGDIRYAVEELLSRITEIHLVTLLITMRGIVRPAQTHWTKPWLAPLKTLTHDAAREIWEQIADNCDDSAEELIKAVDYVPLAVNLLAHLAQATSPVLLLREWNKKQTGLIQMDQTHKLSNLEYSIQLSIDSRRMKANPSAKDLLGVLSILPDGIHIKQLERFNGILLDMDILLSLQVLQQCSMTRVIGERYQTHPIIRCFCNHHDLISKRHRDSLINFYIGLASFDPSYAQPNEHAEMVVEVNNTKAILFHLLESNYEDDAELVNAILMFEDFHSSIGDHSDELISDYISARNKAQEAEKLCLSSLENNSTLHAKIFCDLGELHLLLNELEDAEALYQKALAIYKIANDNWGQGKGCYGLGQIYARLGKLNEAESSFSKALEFHTNGNEVAWQGDDYDELGEIYLRLGKLDKAKTSFYNALDLHKIANDNLGQGNDYNGLGHAFLELHKPCEAEISFHKALKFHKLANNILGQGNDYCGLGNVYLSLGKLHEAESSFYKALDLHKVANDVLGQGNNFQGLGKLYMKMSQLKDAKSMFEKALIMHTQAQDPVWQKRDQQCLSEVLSKLG